MKARQAGTLFHRVRGILESARSGAARSVNTIQVVANWLIGREIIEEEQEGKRRADYGGRLIAGLSKQLTADFGRGFTVRNLEMFRAFYLQYPDLLIPHALRAELGSPAIWQSLLGSPGPDRSGISHATRAESWRPGLLHPDLSWTHYRTLLRVEKQEIRAFYEIEALENGWSARELERQINSLLYERLALNRNKKNVMRLAKKGHEVQRPVDAFKDPLVMEFLALPESPSLSESHSSKVRSTTCKSSCLNWARASRSSHGKRG